MESLGDRLKALREARGLSAAELGRLTGIREGTIFKIERGDSKEPGFTHGLKLAQALEVTPNELAGIPPGASAAIVSAVDDLSGKSKGRPDFQAAMRDLRAEFLEREADIRDRLADGLEAVQTVSGLPQAAVEQLRRVISALRAADGGQAS